MNHGSSYFTTFVFLSLLCPLYIVQTLSFPLKGYVELHTFWGISVVMYGFSL